MPRVFGFPRVLIALVALSLGGLLVSGPAHAEDKRLAVYCWQGHGTGSNLKNPKFEPKWRAVLEDAKNDITIEIFPSAERILEQAAKSDILYTSTHSGVPKGATEQGVQIGEKGDARYVLLASEIAAANVRRPRLVIVNGCSTLPLLPEEGAVRNLATAFGINAATKGRAYIGFQDVHGGAKGDDYFRVFFYFWSGVGGKDLTLAQAADKARDYINEQVDKLGGDRAQEFLLSKAAATVRKDMVILGDATLRYRDLR
jgi:hypothetical protein